MTRFLSLTALLYSALLVAVNPVFGEALTRDAILELREGDMRKLIIHEEPRDLIDVSFFDEDGEQMKVTDFEGKTILLNFWATWCAPCRAEMPSLDALNQELGGDDFRVVTISSGRNPAPAVDAFFTEAAIETLPKYADPKLEFSRASRVLGLPVTLVLNAEGAEIARLQGEAEWNSANAKEVLSALIAQDK